MKKILILLFLSATVPAWAQFQLKGKILHYSGKDSLAINIPLIYGFHPENTVRIPVAGDGTFNIALPAQSIRFASLYYQRRSYSLLLSPGKELTVQWDEQNKQLQPLSGSALQENTLLRKINFDETPFFLQHETGLMPLDELNSTIRQPYFHQQQQKTNTVQASDLPWSYKKLIAAELRYLTFNHLNDLARSNMRNRAALDSFIISVFDSSRIEPEVWPAGPQYFAFAGNYVRYLETKAFRQIKKENIPSSEPIPYFGISLDSATVLVNKYGKPYWRWIGSLQNFPPDVTEVYNYQQIINLYQYKDLTQAQHLAAAFRQRFPASRFNPDIDQKINGLRQMLAQHASNKDIVVIDSVRSIYDVIKTLKGKVVYLDVWGTWCGPCKEQLKHTGPLKAAFKNKAVAFVYLDMDEDHRENTWREFIKVNGLAGIHFRKNRQTIAPIWKELLAEHPDKREYYPQYFIFDKTGKPAVAKAFQPDDKEKLYRQIEEVLAR
ncbi:redoxin family protein [Chitinophaga lutea]|nr:redoxin family protein [Chitinophaga lutea]